MKNVFKSLLAIGFAVAAPFGTAHAVTSFSSNFEEDLGPSVLNYNGFTNWDVTVQSVDLIHEPGFGILCQDTMCLDTNGSTGHGGTVTTKVSFDPGTYLVKFDISGNQRGGATDSLSLIFGSLIDTFFKDSADPFETITRIVTIGVSSTLSFAAPGTDTDNIGIILDNVSVSAVPLPAALPLFATAVGGMGLLGWRRRRATAAA